MKIQSICVDGFRNLSKVKLDMDKITALVSLNNFGKSNVLDAIDFAINFIRSDNAQMVNQMSSINNSPMNIANCGSNYSFELEGITDSGAAQYRINYGFEFSWGIASDAAPAIVREFLRVKIDEKGQKYAQLVDRNKLRTLYKSCETGRCSSKLSVSSTELAISKLKAYDGLFYADVIKELIGLKFYLENNLDAKSFYRPDPFIKKGLDDVMVDSSNLPWVIYKLQREYEQKFEILKHVYSQLFPNVEDIIVRQFNLENKNTDILPDDSLYHFMNSIYVLYVKMSNLVIPVDFNLMSDGAKRVFLILTKVLLAKIGNVSLVAIEEPENSVHPSLFRAYINIISQLLDDCKIIITSHSPYIISYMDPAWIRLGVEQNDGLAEFYAFKSAGQKKLKEDAADIGISIGDYIFSMLADSDSSLIDYLERATNE